MSAQCHPLPPDCHLRAQEPAVAHNELVSAQAHGTRRYRHLSGKNPYSLRQRCRVASVFCKKDRLSVHFCPLHAVLICCHSVLLTSTIQKAMLNSLAYSLSGLCRIHKL